MYVHTRRGKETGRKTISFSCVCTESHATTGLSPYEVLFGVDPPSLSLRVQWKPQTHDSRAEGDVGSQHC